MESCAANVKGRLVIKINQGKNKFLDGYFRILKDDNSFLQHSLYGNLTHNACNPNCILQCWELEAKGQCRVLVKVGAIELAANEELSVDFGNPDLPCRCTTCSTKRSIPDKTAALNLQESLGSVATSLLEKRALNVGEDDEESLKFPATKSARYDLDPAEDNLLFKFAEKIQFSRAELDKFIEGPDKYVPPVFVPKHIPVMLAPVQPAARLPFGLPTALWIEMFKATGTCDDLDLNDGKDSSYVLMLSPPSNRGCKRH